MISRTSLLTALAASADRDIQITSLFDADPNRLSRFVMREGPLRADFSKQALDAKGLDGLLDMAAKCDLEEWRAKLFAGERVNTSEDRAVLHMALRCARIWPPMQKPYAPKASLKTSSTSALAAQTSARALSQMD